MELLNYISNTISTKNQQFLFYTFSSIFVFYIIRKFCNRPKTWLKPSVEGKTIIFTGASDGIAKEAALQLVRDGALVIFACRNKEKTLAAISELKDQKHKSRAIFIELDLSSFDSIKKFVKEFKLKFQKLDILVNNAALVNQNYQITADGIEATLQTNTFRR